MISVVEQLKNIWIQLGPSKIHGLGIIAIRDIPKDTTIFHFANDSIVEYSYDYLLKNGVDKETIKIMKKYYAHNDKTIQLPYKINPMHYVHYINHNLKPNVYYYNGNYITRRNVKKNEELTISYLENNYCPDCIDFKDKTKKKTKKNKRR